MSSELGASGAPQTISPATSLSSPRLARPVALDRPASHGSILSVSTTSSSSTSGGGGSGAKLPKFLLRSSSKKEASGSSSSKKADRGGKLSSRRRKSDASLLDMLPSTAEGAVEGDTNDAARPSVTTTNASRRGIGGHSRQSTVSQIDFEPEEILAPASTSQRGSVASLDDQAFPVKPRKTSRTKTLKKKTSKLFSTKDRSSSNGAPTTAAGESQSPSLEALQQDSTPRSASPSSTVSSDPIIVVDPPLRGMSSPPTSMRRPSKDQQPRSRPGSTASTDSTYHQQQLSVGGFYQQPAQQAGSAVRIQDIATAIPNRLGGWLSNFLPSHQQPSSSPPSALSSSPNSSTPIPPSLHAASSPPRQHGGQQQGQRSFVAAAREKGALTRYFLDSDAKKPERNTEAIWIMGRQHDGWRASEQLQQQHSDGGSPAERPSGLPQPPSSHVAVGSPQRKTSAPSNAHSSSTSPGRFTNLFSASSISLIGNPNGDDSSPRRDKGKKEDVRWPADFYEDFRTSVWCTYRSQYAAFAALPPPLLGPPPSAYDADGLPTPAFLAASKEHVAVEPPIPRVQSGWAWVKSGGGADDKGLTTDSGWGCMLRTGQTLLANGLIRHHLGRDWRRPETPPTADSPPQEILDYATYVRILSWFMDDPLPHAPFSVHRMALVGKQLGKEVGEWFGPSTAAGAIRTLVGAYPYAGVAVSVASDSVIVKSDVFAASQSAPAADAAASLGRKSAAAAKATPRWGSRPVIVLVGIRLGLDGVNPIYHESVRDLFTFPQSLGIAGGRPSSSYYFLGFQGDSLIYLDPHHTRPAVVAYSPPTREELLARSMAATQVAAPAKPRGPSALPSVESASPASSPDLFSSPPAARSTHSLLSTRRPSPSPSRVMRADSPGFSPTPAHRPSPSPSHVGLDPLAQWFAGAYSSQALQTFHCDKVRKMSFSQLDPSMLLGFLCKDEADWDDFRSRVANMPHAIFSISDEASSWDDDDDVGLESFSETDPELASNADERESISGSLSRPSSDALDDDLGPIATDEGDAELITKEEATVGSPFAKPQLHHARMASVSSVVAHPTSEAGSSQATPQHLHGPSHALRPISAPATERPVNPRALGSEFELLDDDDWRAAESEDALEEAGVDPTPGSPVSKRPQRQTLADRLQASTLAFPSLSKGSDDSLNGSSSGTNGGLSPAPPPRTKAARGVRLRRTAGRRSISGATARPLGGDDVPEGPEGDEEKDDDDDDDDWNDHS